MKGFNLMLESKVAHISIVYAHSHSISIEDAFRQVLASQTYELLADPETGLCLEMFEYVYEMFLEERGEIIK